MKKLLTFFLFFFTILGFFIILPDNVKASNVILDNFDSYAEGVSSGTNGYLFWESQGINPLITSTTQKVSSPNSLKIRMDDGADSNTYFNLTESISINYFKFKFDDVWSTNKAVFYIYLYNSTGIFITFKIDNDYVYVYDYNNWAKIYETQLSGLGWFTIGFQGNHSESNPLNYVYYYVKDSDNVLVSQIEKRWISLKEFNITDLVRIKCYLNCDDFGIGGLLIKAYIDDIETGFDNDFGTTGLFDYDEGYVLRCMNSGSTSTTSTMELESDCTIDWPCGILAFFHIGDLQDCSDCPITYNPTRYIEYKTNNMYSEIIHDVFLPIGAGQYNYVSSNVNDYSMIINGIDCGTADYIINYGPYNDYAIVWKDVDKLIDNESILFCFKSDKTTTIFSKAYYWWDMFFTVGGSGDTRTHNNINSYLNNNLDGQVWGNAELYICWSLNESTIVDPYKPCEECEIILDYYDDYFGIGDNNSGYMEFYNFEQLCGYKVGQSPSIYFNLSGYGVGNGIKYYAYRIYQQTGTSGLFVDNGIIEVIGDYRKGVITSTFQFPSSGKYYIMVYNATSDGMTLNNFTHRSESVGVCDVIIQPITRTTEIDYNWIFAICIIMGFIIAPVILFRTNQFFIHNGAIIVALFGIIGLGICINFGLVELWFAFLVALICVGIMALKIYDLIKGNNGD